MSGISPDERRWAWRGDLVQAGLLAALAMLIWCTLYDRWTAASWQTPVAYLEDENKSDIFSLFAGIKAAGEGDIGPIFSNNVPQLGAPHVANWDDFPATEKPLIVLTGGLANLIGLFPAANFALMLAHILAALAFFATARLLGAASSWALAGALIFAFSRFLMAQGLHHLTVTYCWHVPLCLVVAIWMFREEGIPFRAWQFRFALIVALITGMQNVYYTNMLGQLVLLGGFYQAWRRGWAAMLPALAIVGVAAGGFVLMNFNTFAHALTAGPNPGAVVRNYKWIEVYGLKVVDFVVPPPDHPFPPFAAWGAAHLKEVLLSPAELPPSGYFGLAGLAALAWLVVESARSVMRGEAVPLAAWLVLWIFFYATVGGLNAMVATLGSELFRATNRYGIFILALVLLEAARRPSLPAWGRGASGWLVAAGLALVALWDQTPPVVTAGAREIIARDVASDRDFTAKMESRLPDGAMVFQIPVLDFPETSAPGVPPYDHFRPYLYSNHLRFSFGSDKGRPQDQWQHDLEKHSFADAVRLLESYGFGALYINLNVFTDHGVALQKTLAAAGHADMFTNTRGDLLCVILKPSSTPEMPDRF